MSPIQPIDELEKWWESDPDPWKYENDPADIKRRNILMSLIPEKEYERVLDIGCGNGFITLELPGKSVLGIDISENAIKHAKRRAGNQKRIEFRRASLFDIPFFEKQETYDLIVITGVLYPQYIGESKLLVYSIIDDILRPGGFLLCCHIAEWYSLKFPFYLVKNEFYPYKEYTHIYELYMKIQSSGGDYR